MASAMPEEVEDEIVELLGCKRDEIIRASGKTGMGVEEILAAVIERIPIRRVTRKSVAGVDFRFCLQFFPWYHCIFKIVNGDS